MEGGCGSHIGEMKWVLTCISGVDTASSTGRGVDKDIGRDGDFFTLD